MTIHRVRPRGRQEGMGGPGEKQVKRTVTTHMFAGIRTGNW